MARRGSGSDVVQFKTNVTSIRFPKVLMEDMVAMIKMTKYFTNRSDFIIYSVRRFNEYTLSYILKNMSSNPGSNKEYWTRTAAISEELLTQLNVYCEKSEVGLEDDSNDEQPYKVTYSITEGLQEYISLLNQNTWKFDSVQTYIRVAVARMVDKLRENKARILYKSSVLGQDFINATCSSHGRGSVAYEEGELMIDIPGNKQVKDRDDDDVQIDVDDRALIFDDDDEVS